jgi:hypothetical protein
MSSLRAWVETRRPPPPPELMDGLLVASPDGPGAPADLVGALLTQARVRLHAARAQPEVRASAYELLAADALITYACEAALETGDADTSLVRLLSVGERR